VRGSVGSSLWGISLIILMIGVLGCAAPARKETVERVPEQIEKIADPREALLRWKIVATRSPSNETAMRKIAELTAQCNALADEHFRKGVSYYQNNQVGNARKEFLLTLYYNQDHKEALEYLKEKLTGEDATLYDVKKGDTANKIAEKVYGDTQKDFLVSYFNDLKKDHQVKPNAVLRLPILEAVPLKREGVASKQAPVSAETVEEPKEVPFDSTEMLVQARTSLKARKYQDVASIAESVLGYDPANREAHDLVNESYYQMGKAFVQKKKYEDALAMLGRVEPGYKDTRDSLTFVKKQLAETHYLAGVRYFINEDLEKAIREWEEALKLNPNHSKAKSDMERAQGLLEKLKEVK